MESIQGINMAVTYKQNMSDSTTKSSTGENSKGDFYTQLKSTEKENSLNTKDKIKYKENSKADKTTSADPKDMDKATNVEESEKVEGIEEEEVTDENLVAILELLKLLISNSDDATLKEIEKSPEASNIVELLVKNEGAITSEEQLNVLKQENSNAGIKEEFVNLLSQLEKTEDFQGNVQENLQENQVENKVMEEIKTLLNINQAEDKSVNVQNSTVENLEVNSKPIDGEGIKNTSSTDTSQENPKNSDKDSNLSKEDFILQKLTGEEKEEKVARVADYMTILNNSIENVDKTNVSEPTFITRSELDTDIVKALTYMDDNGVKDLTVKIYPKELGEVTISVVMEDGALKAMVKATSKEAAQLLASNLRDINEKISGENIKIDSVEIGLYEDDTTYFNNQRNNSSSGENENNSKTSAMDDEINNIDEVEEIHNDNSTGAINILI